MGKVYRLPSLVSAMYLSTKSPCHARSGTMLHLGQRLPKPMTSHSAALSLPMNTRKGTLWLHSGPEAEVKVHCPYLPKSQSHVSSKVSPPSLPPLTNSTGPTLFPPADQQPATNDNHPTQNFKSLFFFLCRPQLQDRPLTCGDSGALESERDPIFGFVSCILPVNHLTDCLGFQDHCHRFILTRSRVQRRLQLPSSPLPSNDKLQSIQHTYQGHDPISLASSAGPIPSAYCLRPPEELRTRQSVLSTQYTPRESCSGHTKTLRNARTSY